jgi:hypothetical protein
VRSGDRCLALLETIEHSLIDFCTVAPFVRRQRHHCIMDLGIDRQRAIERLFRPLLKPILIEGRFVDAHVVGGRLF